ncbi:tubulin-specific chaperone E-like isoform X3 [Amphibalanus amphitrite]|uniref:tubulin-specific chaperone E-like isoform X3 n=1 Tax=Amphibalanus amphitrite TaxID=1232801 RepID=UPI001C90F3E0|nr:tubulin-specific chaperone E-like isoform X3 [Amphibalanus amphitrite]
MTLKVVRTPLSSSSASMCEPNTAEEWVPTVGDRVCCDGQRATVRFVGSVTGADGLWVGVEWDNPERGKHNGTVKGKQYFMTSHATGGSMVRPRKLARPVQCAQAVVDRYGAILDTDSTVDRQELDALQQDINARFVQVIGLTKLNKKQSKLDQLKNVYLRDSCVAGDSSQLLGQLCPNIEELDLAENLLSSWAAVAEITRQLPKLRILNISENRLAEPDAALRPAFASLQILMANRQRYTWEEVLQCAPMWPDVRRLTLVTNRIRSLAPPPPEVFQQLDSLDLDSNPIGNWAEVMKLASLPKLRDLGLANTGLRRLEVPEQSDALFPALQAIVLDSNQIDEWSSVSALDRLPALVDVTLRNNPVTAIEKPETTRELIIARVSKLQVLNRTEVTREERRWAELDYLRRFGPAWREAGGRLPAAERGDAWRAFLQTHPRYPAICDAWGAPEDSELKITSDTISANMVSVRLVLLTREGEQLRDLERRLPLTMRLSKLKVLVNKLFRGNIKQLELSYRSPGQDESREIAMDRDRDLRFFGVEEGDLIIARY